MISKKRMTTFDFTPRQAIFVKKCIEAYGEDFKKDFEEKSKMTAEQFTQKVIDDRTDGDYIYKAKSMGNSDKSIRISFTIDFTFQDEDEEETDNPELINMKSLKPMIVLHYNEGIRIGFTFATHHGFTEYDWVDSLIKTYHLCACNDRFAEIKGFCKDCYIRTTEQEDVCCCCGENEGIWIKLGCNHLIHLHCWRRIESIRTEKGYCTKCPLCRNVGHNSDYTKI